jgi:hypothetical protein
MKGPDWSLLRQALYSNTALRKLYALRQERHPAEGNRTRINLAVTSVLLALLLGYIFSAGRKTESHLEYLADHPGIAIPAAAEAHWSITPVQWLDCKAADCLASAPAFAGGITPVDDLVAATVSTIATATGTAAAPLPATGKGKPVVALRLDLAAAPIDRVASGRTSLVVSLPEFVFHRAAVLVDGRHVTTVYDRERLRVGIEPTVRAHTIDVVLELEAGQKALLASHDEEPLFISGRDELAAYQQFRAAAQVGRGDYAGAMARIVMAVFMLVLFLFVDGTPESLGLSVFLGFEAFALSLKYGWLPLANTSFLANYAFQMGDILRLYFFLQLARVAGKSLLPWLFWGSVLSIPYGLLRHYEVDLGIAGLTAIPIGRDIVVGVLGAFMCARAAASIRGMDLPWRQVALLLAAFASLQQTMDPLRNVFPVLARLDWWVTTENFLTPTSVYLIALSALINISTLENRVKTLSAVQTRAQEIEREMELGRTVQRAFMTLPPLPEEVAISCHHEAISFVSGDTYYVYRDERRRRVVFLVNDVTGHGVQAALKASVCNAIANSVWRDRDHSHQVIGDGHLLAAFERSMQEFLGRLSDSPDITAMIGAELDEATGALSLFRANTTFPIVVEPLVALDELSEPHLGERWAVRALVFDNRSVHSIRLRPGSVVLFLTDGFIGGSRDLNLLIRHLRVQLARRDQPLTAADLQAIALKHARFAAPLADDRTLLACQWLGPNAKVRTAPSPLTGAAGG